METGAIGDEAVASNRGCDDRVGRRVGLDERVDQLERLACPTQGSCSGMFTANSMNCLNEAIGPALGNGTIPTHATGCGFSSMRPNDRGEHHKYYFDGDESVLPRHIANRALPNAMTLYIAISTNTILHTLAIAHEGAVDFTLDDIDRLSRQTPCICKVAPNTKEYHVQDVNRAGGILGILHELAKAGMIDTSVRRVDGMTLAEALDRYDITKETVHLRGEAYLLFGSR